MSEDLQQISLFIDPESDDGIRAAEDTISLARELRQLDVYGVELGSSGGLLPGTRGVDMVSAGSLVVLAAGSRVLLRIRARHRPGLACAATVGNGVHQDRR